jgi:hypothetical protein
LKKLRRKEFALKLDSFFNKSQEGIGCPSAPLRMGPDGVVLELQGTIPNVAPVSIKYLSRVSSSVRKMTPAFAWKSIAVVVACVDIAAEPVRVRRLFSFHTKHRVKYT